MCFHILVEGFSENDEPEVPECTQGYSSSLKSKGIIRYNYTLQL